MASKRQIQILVGVLLLVTAVGAVASDTSPYRFAGSIITSDNGRRLAFVETPDGAQHLLRKGDSIDGGTVTEITRNTVRLQFKNEELVLTLAGTGKTDYQLPTEFRPEDYYAGAMVQPVDGYKLDELRRLSSSADETESTDRAKKVLNRLGLPKTARIMAINDSAVESPAEALKQMAQSIQTNDNGEGGMQFVISIADVSGNKRVYVMAQGPDLTVSGN